MTDQSPRWAFPLLQPGQAQKEMFHNEALVAIDMIVQAVVVSADIDTPPASPAPGACWIVGDAPTGDWAGRAGCLAGWTGGGWRFVPPVEGMAVWIADQALPGRFREGEWVAGVMECHSLTIGGEQVVGARQSAIPDPSAGVTIDAEARSAIGAILAALRGHGLIEA